MGWKVCGRGRSGKGPLGSAVMVKVDPGRSSLQWVKQSLDFLIHHLGLGRPSTRHLLCLFPLPLSHLPSLPPLTFLFLHVRPLIVVFNTGGKAGLGGACFLGPLVFLVEIKCLVFTIPTPIYKRLPTRVVLLKLSPVLLAVR